MPRKHARAFAWQIYGKAAESVSADTVFFKRTARNSAPLTEKSGRIPTDYGRNTKDHKKIT